MINILDFAKQNSQNAIQIGNNELNEIVTGLRHGIYGIAAPPNVGITSFIHQHCIIHPFKYCITKDTDKIKIIYYGLHTDLESVMMRFLAYFYFERYGELISATNYMDLRIEEDKEEEEEDKEEKKMKTRIKFIEENYLNKLFGENGMIVFKNKIPSVNEIKSEIIHIFKQHGIDEKEEYSEIDENDFVIKKERNKQYHPNKDSPKFVFIIDDARKVKNDNSYKKPIEVLCSTLADLSEHYRFPVVLGINTAKTFTDLNNLKHYGKVIYPTAKDLGFNAEDIKVLITLFDPANLQYKLETHMDVSMFADNEETGLRERLVNYRIVSIINNRFGKSNKILQYNCNPLSQKWEQITMT